MSMANAKLNSAGLTLLLPRVKIRNTSYANWQMTCSNVPTQANPLSNLIHIPDQFADIAEPTLSEPNEGEGLLLNEMESSWRAAVRRLENPGDVIERRPITMPEGLYLFQLIEKSETPTFEALAEQFEAEWDEFYEEVMNPKPENIEEGGDSQEDTSEETETQESDTVSTTPEPPQQPDTTDTDENQSVEQIENDTDEDQRVAPDESEDNTDEDQSVESGCARKTERRRRNDHRSVRWRRGIRRLRH